VRSLLPRYAAISFHELRMPLEAMCHLAGFVWYSENY
jgi:hypothetical protein